MPLLLDTQVFIQAMRGELSGTFRVFLATAPDVGINVYVSVVSLWEIAIKARLGKLNIPVPVQQAGELARTLGFGVLALSEAHAVEELSIVPFANDPFDRLLLAIAQVEAMKLVTLDRALVNHPLAFKS